MNPFYQKLRMSIDDINLFDVKGTTLTDHYTNKQGYGLYYYDIKPEYITALRNKVPAELQQEAKIFYAELVTPASLVPHKDHGVLSAINYYFQPSDGMTTWYNVKQGALPYRLNGRTTSNIFRIEDVELVDQFIAQPNEAYLLNNNSIHNISVSTDIHRLFICWLWPTIPFERSREILAANGFIEE